MGLAFDHGTPGGAPTPPAAPNGQRPVPGPWTGTKASGGVSEEEIGDIIVQAQRFAEETAKQAEHRARTVIDAAQAEAQRIVEEARRQAVAAAVPARQAIPPEAVANLFATIDGFARTNTALVAELKQLRQVLAGPVPAPTAVPTASVAARTPAAPQPVAPQPAVPGVAPAQAGTTPVAAPGAVPGAPLPPRP